MALNLTTEKKEVLRLGLTVYTILDKIAEGGFSSIHLARGNGVEQVVLKTINTNRSDVKAIADLEVKLLKTLKHPNIISYLNSGDYPGFVHIILEYCPGGNLWECVKKQQGVDYSDKAVWYCFRDVCRAVAFLHEQGIAHWDIKMDNVLKTSGGVFKLCDFGSCQYGTVACHPKRQLRKAEELIQKYTSPIYRAPEMIVILNNSIGVYELTAKVDVWALGCILYSLCYFTHPFVQTTNLGILNAKYTIPHNPKRCKALHTCIQACLQSSRSVSLM